MKLRELRGVEGGRREDENEPLYDARSRPHQQVRDDIQGVCENVPSPASDSSQVLSDTSNLRNDRLPEMEGRKAEGNRIEPHLPDPPKISAASNQSNLNILIVEDNAINSKLLGAFLKKYGCRNLQYAQNGALAVQAVEDRPQGFDIIFMGQYNDIL